MGNNFFRKLILALVAIAVIGVGFSYWASRPTEPQIAVSLDEQRNVTVEGILDNAAFNCKVPLETFDGLQTTNYDGPHTFPSLVKITIPGTNGKDYLVTYMMRYHAYDDSIEMEFRSCR